MNDGVKDNGSVVTDMVFDSGENGESSGYIKGSKISPSLLTYGDRQNRIISFLSMFFGGGGRFAYGQKSKI